MRELVLSSDPCLRQSCSQIEKIDGYVQRLASDMLQFLSDYNALGLRAYGIAAPQLGEPIRLLVVATPAVTLTAINPVITKTFGMHNWIESCLSLPGQLYMVHRPKLIKFQYLSLDGQMHAAHFHDDYAGIFVHEIDHLSGILIDSIGKLVLKEAIAQS